MKICMFTNTYLPHVGGVARSVSNFARDLSSQGLEVMVVAPEFPQSGDYTDDPQVFRIPAIQNFNGSDFSVSIPLPFVLKERLKEFSPDIIHSHHPFLLGDTGMRAARQRNLPLVFTHHTLYEEYIHYVPLNSKHMKKFVISLSTQYANLCSQVIAPSRSIAELMRSRGVKVDISEIPTGIEPQFFEQGKRQLFRRKFDLPEKAFVIGHLGRLAQEKNLDFLARAVAEFIQKAEEEAYFLVVGAGPSQEEIQKIFQKKGLSKRLILAGQKTGEELAAAYKAMDLFAFSSKSETQGMVLAEAMAAGLPVLALDAPGAREVVQDKINGRLLPGQASTEEYAKTLKTMSKDKQAYAGYVSQARKTAQEFSRQSSAQKLIQLYEKTLSKRLPDKGFEQEELFAAWDRLLRSIKAEWELLSQKTQAMVRAVKE